MSENHQQLDNTDRHILRILAHDGRINNLALAEAVNLSPTPCARRVKRLENLGIIQGYRAELDPEALGYHLSIFIAVTMDAHTPERFEHFEAAVKDFPEVISMSIVTGRVEDFLLHVVVKDMASYEAFLLGKLNRLPGVHNVHSSFELRSVFNRSPQP
ncbi:Lrp/AsnC family transcriptional regulator [Suttonella sp. R2A3]|uniref:Lrp/AsnC family transcriptional regulator n=1 Tax=Suttonella sp. R2A3 TaxID=2908648 RepID=UPI001F37AF50|nr:Lrp/AsnC family transcriptional regulator [Suttonella sp. R2A3]UJF25251.1 Lrp/AsnC family transcriptional regulator [Suttonella sp. R2A3]